MRRNVLLGGQSFIIKAYDKLGETGIMLHCAKHNLMLGGSGGMPPQENFEK